MAFTTRSLSTPSNMTTSAEFTAHFRGYLRVINMRIWSNLSAYVASRISLNGRKMSQDAFSSLIAPGAVFSADMVVADVSKRTLTARMDIEFPVTLATSDTAMENSDPVHEQDCKIDSLGGKREIRRIKEHVFYHFNEAWRIDQVWSVFTYGESWTREPAAAALDPTVLSFTGGPPSPAAVAAKSRLRHGPGRPNVNNVNNVNNINSVNANGHAHGHAHGTSHMFDFTEHGTQRAVVDHGWTSLVKEREIRRAADECVAAVSALDLGGVGALEDGDGDATPRERLLTRAM